VVSGPDRTPSAAPPTVVWKRTWVQDRPAQYALAVGSVDDGALPDVLLLHGWALGQHSYREVIAHLAARGARVWAPAMPGFGGSAELPSSQFSIAGFAEWVDEFCSAVHLDRVVVIGHSFGGGVAIRLAHDHPTRVHALVLVNSIGGSAWKQGSRLRSLAERPLWDWGLHFPADIWPLPQATKVIPVILEDALPNLVRNPRNVYRVGMMARRADLRRELEALRTSGLPITVLWAKRDGVIPREAFEATCVAAGVSGHVVDGSHSWLLVDPAGFGEVMTNVIEVARAAHQIEIDAEPTPKRRKRERSAGRQDASPSPVTKTAKAAAARRS
jgi:pimeloyl-ACP methyl ester carboxylesterase